jgi:plasmid stabilization system protein ParE
MNPQITFYSEAEDEVFEALAWYADRSSLAARAFVQELSHVVRLAAQSPESWPNSFAKTRRVVFPRFPFDLIFRTTGDAIEIDAVAHHRRRPFYWQHR